MTNSGQTDAAAEQSSINTRPNRDRVYPPGYGVVEPVANYRPWELDEQFQVVYAAVRDHTMVDIYRLWVLWTLAGRLPAGDILEVGSWRGGSGAVLARRAAGGGTGGRVWLADTFAGVVKAGERDSYYRGGEHANTSPEVVRELLERLGVGNAELLVGTFPEETGAGIAGRNFALCHIDVDVYQSAMDVFRWAWPRMVPGGVVVFDDYGFYGCEGVTACVEEVVADLSDGVFVPNLSGQAVITRVGY